MPNDRMPEDRFAEQCVSFLVSVIVFRVTTTETLGPQSFLLLRRLNVLRKSEALREPIQEANQTSSP